MEAFPEDGRPYVSLGKLMVEQRRYKEALALYEEGCTATGAPRLLPGALQATSAPLGLMAGHWEHCGMLSSHDTAYPAPARLREACCTHMPAPCSPLPRRRHQCAPLVGLGLPGGQNGECQPGSQAV